MTLLVLELKPERLGPSVDDAEMWHSLADLKRPLLAYALTFVLAGTFWILQHRKFSLLSHTTLRHTWLTLAFLFAVTLLPLSISIWIPHLGRKPGILLYYANFAFIALTLLAGWIDALMTKLVNGDPALVRKLTQRLILLAVSAVAGAAVTVVDVQYGGIATALVLVFGRLWLKPARA